LGLDLPGNAREQHRYLVTGVAIAVASHDNAGALQPGRGRGLEGDHHFGPLRNRGIAAKFDSVFSKANCVSGEVELSGLGLESYRL
jgi:hypothetical protein